MRRVWSLAFAVVMVGLPTVALGAVPAAADQTPPTVTLLDAGDGPRARLRYDLDVGAEQEIELAVLTRIGQTVDGDTRNGSSPRVAFTVKLGVTDVAADSVITASYTYESVDVGNGSASDSASEERVRDQVEPLIGLTATFTMTGRGQVLSSDVAVPTDVDPATSVLIEQLAQQAGAIAVPLPARAVGEGARWRASTTFTLSGIELHQQTEYELVANDHGTIEIESRLTQRADHQTYTDPASGEAVELITSEGEGDGTITARLTKLAPLEADAHVTVHQKLTTGGSTVSQSVRTHTFIKPA
jgi:hypothetical protein